jgi:hypothetical protein
MPNLNEMIESKYLKASDFSEPRVMTVRAFKKTNVARENEEPRYRWLVKFDESDKPMVLNTTNIKRMAKIFASENTDNWVGKPVEIYNDDEVEFGGNIVGGLRVRKANGARRSVRDVNAEISGGVDSMSDEAPF